MNLKAFINELKLTLKMRNAYGSDFALKRFYYKYTHQTKKYIENAASVIKPYVDSVEQTVQNANIEKMPDEVPVWILWWQGYNQMPDIVRICYENVKNNLPDNARLNFISKENYSSYVDISEKIISKTENGLLSITNLSDLLRQKLLVKHGGFWIDSTIYCSKPISKDFLRSDHFWSVKLKPFDDYSGVSYGQMISNRMWGGFIQKAPPNHIINRYTVSAMEKIMIENDILPDYFYQNIIIRLLYESNPNIREEIDSIPYSNPCLYDLKKNFNMKYSDEMWEKYIKYTTFFKLTWKKKYQEFDENNKKTFYGHLICQL